MSRARSAIAVRTTIDLLESAALEAFGATAKAQADEALADFEEAVDFCRPHTEEFGGDEGEDGWYLWQVGDWAILGDLTVCLQRAQEALEKLSRKLGPVVVGALDGTTGYAHFSVFENGKVRRRLELEDEAFTTEGLPLPAERGRPVVEFDETEAERLWTSYGLPTFDHDPLGGPFTCVAIDRA